MQISMGRTNFSMMRSSHMPQKRGIGVSMVIDSDESFEEIDEGDQNSEEHSSLEEINENDFFA